MKKQTTYAKDGILGKDAHNILIKTAYTHDCDGAEMFINTLNIADIAWVLTLKKAHILNNIDELLQALLQLNTFEIDPKYGDIYNSKNIALKQITSKAENLHISRPRREAINIAYYLKVKQKLFELFKTAKQLSQTFLKISKKYENTIMPDFTYMHHAQPTTFGHYILTFLFPLLRDLERAQLAYKHLELSPAGSGSVNGCSFNIDREYLAKLLGFNGIEYHARDSMWRSDLPIEILYITASMLTNLARLSDELQIFSTAEFNMIILPPSLCRASVIMPNKQNPYPLTYIRGVSNEIQGKLTSFIAYEKVVSGNPDSRTFVYVDTIKALEKTTGVLKLFQIILEQMEVNTQTLLQRVQHSFFYATDIADWLIQHYNITYEEAHTEVGRVIRYMKENNYDPREIKEEYFQYKIHDLHKLTDPFKSIKRKNTPGSVGDIRNILKSADIKLKQLTIKPLNLEFLQKELQRLGYEFNPTI